MRGAGKLLSAQIALGGPEVNGDAARSTTDINNDCCLFFTVSKRCVINYFFPFLFLFPYNAIFIVMWTFIMALSDHHLIGSYDDYGAKSLIGTC